MAMDNKERTGLDADDPLFRQLVLGINYSRALVFTYYYVIIVTILLFALGNARFRYQLSYAASREGVCSKSTKRQKIQPAGAPSSMPASGVYARENRRPLSSGASSLTLCDVEAGHEQTPLLKKTPMADSRGTAARWRDWAMSCLMHQPSPIFLNRPMPSNAVSLFILAYAFVNLVYLFHKVDFSKDMLFVLADRAGALFSTNLPILYILSSKTQPLRCITGYSHASLNILHRRLGEWMCILAASHGSLMFATWAVTLREKGYPFAKFIADRVTVLGILTMVFYQLLLVTSVAKVRRVAYEFFLASHILLQIGGLASLYFHHSKSRPYVLASLGVWLADRVLNRMLGRTTALNATLKVMNDGKIVSLSTPITLSKQTIWQKALAIKTIRHGWQSTDHAFISIPSMGWPYMLQGHPFSIASAAPSSKQDNVDLGFVIRAKKGFSKALLDHASRHKSVPIHVDGPYGSQSAMRLLKPAKTRVLIAGGTGIAVTWSAIIALIEHEKKQTEGLELGGVYVIRNSIIFVWVVRSADQYYYVDQSQLAWLKSLSGVTVVLPSPTEADVRPSMHDIIMKWIGEHNDGGDVAVLCSGPDEMARDVRNACSRLVSQGKQIRLETEKYSW